MRETVTAPRGCDHPDCEAEGLHPAPRSRVELRSYRWFCLDHVRAYNRAWNYFAGMDADEVEAQVRRDTTWERPSWPFAGKADKKWHEAAGKFGDAFGAFGSRDSGPRNGARGGFRANGGARTVEERALAVLEVEPPITRDRIKARYKVLVKMYHPDANGGDAAAEERFKRISEAYETLKDRVPQDAQS
jgi:DnaJ-domain-containing protein 1